ncbi:hypothetical protein HKCCE4037_08045 [Rhodobacterales bacterium HKCCE4037]|nr:hypothetical protein [Rhodobacterales bacterium HKCCE4037]
MNRRRNWLIRLSICVIAILVVSMVGPFSTFERFTLGQRFLYWSALILGSLMPAYWIRKTVRGLISGSEFLRDSCGAIAIGLGIGPVIWWLNIQLLNASLASWDYLVEHLLVVWLVCFVPVLIRLNYRMQAEMQAAVHPVTGPDVVAPGPRQADVVEVQPLLRHVEPEKRGPIRRVSAAGHQLKIYTERGETSVRMRFSDALIQLGSADGVQVHRSHWVAKDEIERFEQSGRKYSVTLECGTSLPVSSTHAAELKQIGIPLQDGR